MILGDDDPVRGSTGETASPPLLFAMMSPICERIFEVEEPRTGAVNRAWASHLVASGCAVTAARASTRLGAAAMLVTTVGGDTGAILRGLLDHEEFAVRLVSTSAETRNVTTLVTGAEAGSTVIVEPSSGMSLEDVGAFQRLVVRFGTRARYALLGGSLPPGAPPNSYATLVTELQSAGCTVAIDTRGDAYAHCVSAGAGLIKTNVESLPASVAESGGRDLFQYLTSLTVYGAKRVICTAGGGPASIVWDGVPLTLIPPRVRVMNQFGSGDAAMGALLSGLHEGRDREDVLRLFAATGAANAETLLPGAFSAHRVHELMERVRIEERSFATAG